MIRPTVTFVSARLGEPDGVSIAAVAWEVAFRRLGFRVCTVAGAGTAERLVPGLALDARTPPTPGELDAALEGADLVVVENICSLPINRASAHVVAGCLAGRRAIMHHHDFPWQRPDFHDIGPWPPDDPSWQHVTINELSRRELAERGIDATTVYNAVLPRAAGDGRLARDLLGLSPDRLLLLQPTRAIPRKNVPGGVRLAEALGATYWLTGPAEDGYGAELQRVLAGAACDVRHGIPGGLDMADAYEAADAVAYPSTWEGFGLPLIESALYRKPLAVGRFPMADELAAFGFQWFPADDPASLRGWLECPDRELLEHNYAVARRHFSVEALAGHLGEVLARASWTSW
ncbi:MAG TPA: glycosyltransferase family 4 protein [Actinomycetes bacterium]|jgi:glycosyltransferase involved in cell wall biosynthesis|nr:glycosyltransferase family 4 protein [Actinomycetes bacterium]